MAQHTVNLVANEGIFKGLAKQNLHFHQCIAELVDNSIAATKQDQKFKVDIIFIKDEFDTTSVDVYIADNTAGMSLETLRKALQLGESATTHNRLNEHGFGMKNALATLSGNNGKWKIWTRPSQADDIVYSVEGPFRPEMLITDDEKFPEEFIPVDVSTLVKVRVDMSFIRTVQGQGAPAKDLSTLRMWLIEHLGVFYRGYLEQDTNSYDVSGTIVVSIANNSLRVPPIIVPLANSHTKYFDVEICGQVYPLKYVYGTLDEEKRKGLVGGDKAKYYYQKNRPTQGIDIRLGKRVIATRQFESIWKTGNGDNIKQLERHNSYNDFLGELLIPEMPRGILTTTNSKTDFNFLDTEWEKIFDKLAEHPPIKDPREKSESALKNKWMKMLNATNPEDTITDERNVWPSGVRIDVLRETSDKKYIIYEIKVGSGTPLHLYQLKMYWDGLVLENVQPKEGILLVEDFDPKLEQMANTINTTFTPPNKTKPYNFKIERHRDRNLQE